jgi:pimeloyl-ACP methyl ester carboxylesterase
MTRQTMRLAVCLAVSVLAACAHAPARPALRELQGAPPGGLAYRLYLAEEASAARPQRLVLWLHPSGGSRNAKVARLAPMLAAHGFALLTPVDKDFRHWRTEDANRLLGVTLPSLASIPELDLRRPVLLGFSAGGQLALMLWQAQPEALGGAAVMGTAPVDAFREPLTAPRASAAVQARTPLLVLTGERDVGAAPWRAAERRLRAEGAVLTVRTVVGRGHQWLLDGAELEVFERWLAQLPPP